MNIDLKDPVTVSATPYRGCHYVDNVIPSLAAWSEAGERVALVTLAGVDGNAPRAVGAQMAVAESGRWSGYISGGCLERAIVLEGIAALQEGKPRFLRFGKNSPFFDIRLPCGSGLDVFIQPMFDRNLIRDMDSRQRRREAFTLKTSRADGTAALCLPGESPPTNAEAACLPDAILRFYKPALQCLVVGSSPIASALSSLAANAGFEAVLYAPEPNVAAEADGVIVKRLHPRGPFSVDCWTAAILAFHDHEHELPIFAELLGSPCFFIGAIGSRKAHSIRALALNAAGFNEEAIARIKSPAGVLPGLKTAPFVALSILTEIVGIARAQELTA